MTPRALDGASAQHTGNRHDGQDHTIVVVAIARKRGWRMPRPRAPSGSNQTLGTGQGRSQKGGLRPFGDRDAMARVRKHRSFADDCRTEGGEKRELLIEASVAGLELNPISVSVFHHAPARRVLNKILEPRNAVTISVNHMLVPIDLKANPPAFL
jgi:hypothetical protein